MDEERLAEIEACLQEPRKTVERLLLSIPELVAEVRRLQRDQEWIKAAVTTNQYVCESCADEIARAAGWTD